MRTVCCAFESVMIIFSLLFHHSYDDMCTCIICVCINLTAQNKTFAFWEVKRSISLPVDPGAASSIHPLPSLCVVTSSMCLFIVCFPTAVMLNSGTTSGPGPADSPAHIKQQHGPLPALEKTKTFALSDPPKPLICSKRNIRIYTRVTKTKIQFPRRQVLGDALFYDCNLKCVY